MAPLRCCTSWPWSTFSRSRIFKCEYLEYGERCSPWSLPLFSRSNIFLLCICYKNNCTGSGCFRQICLDSHGPRRGVAIVKKAIHYLYSSSLHSSRLYRHIPVLVCKSKSLKHFLKAFDVVAWNSSIGFNVQIPTWKLSVIASLHSPVNSSTQKSQCSMTSAGHWRGGHRRFTETTACVIILLTVVGVEWTSVVWTPPLDN